MYAETSEDTYVDDERLDSLLDVGRPSHTDTVNEAPRNGCDGDGRLRRLESRGELGDDVRRQLVVTQLLARLHDAYGSGINLRSNHYYADDAHAKRRRKTM